VYVAKTYFYWKIIGSKMWSRRTGCSMKKIHLKTFVRWLW